MKKQLLSLILIIFCVFISHAQPNTFNYQAVVRDTDGNLITNQQTLLRLSITNSEQNIYYEEEHQSTTSEFGQIQIEVGGGTLISGSFVDIPWGAAQLLLNVDMSMDEGNTFTNLGQSPLLGVPYAFYSASGEPGPEGPAGNGIETVEDNGDGTLTFHFTDGSTYTTPNLAGPTIEDQPGNLIYHDSTGWVGTDAIKIAGSNVAIGTNPAISRLLVHGDTAANTDDPIFEVKNKDGNVVFAVYQNGVEVNVDESSQEKGLKGGFAVGGLTGGKDSTVQYFRVTPDSVRVYLREDTTKAQKGGFAVGGLTWGKNKTIGNEYLHVSQDSVRIYIDESGTKAQRGGFAVGGLTWGKNKTPGNEYLRVSSDSVRIYIDESSGKAQKGGFAVGGLTSGKNNLNDFLRVTGDSTRIFVKDYSAGFGVLNIDGTQSTSFLDLTEFNYFIGHESGINRTIGVYNSAIGYLSGRSLASGSYNVFMGYESGKLTYNGSSNVFLGYQAGQQNTSGNNNLYLGYQSGYYNQSGNFNTYMGYQTGYFSDYATSAPNYNTYIGYQSGYNTRSASNNAFIGYRAGRTTSSGSSNVFIGTDAGYSNTTGLHNVYIGHESGRTASTPGYNTFLGYQTGYANTTGSSNVFLGISAGSVNTTGYGNTFVGPGAGNHNTTGFNNVYIGVSSGEYCTTGDFNIVIGPQWDTPNERPGNNNIFIGPNAGKNETGSNKLYIGSTPLIYGDFANQRVGINTTNPDAPLKVESTTANTGTIRSESKYNGSNPHYGGAFNASSGTQGIGCYAAGSFRDFFAGGAGTNYYPFTGAHEVILDANFPENTKPGLIVVLTGHVEKRITDDGSVSLSSTMPEVTLSTKANDKAVLGVFLSEDEHTKDHWLKKNIRAGTVNALGEGRVWVCNSNGPIEAGDYITTSTVPGYGQKQDDDLLHNYTLGKATETINWENVKKTITIKGKTYKVYLVGVVYTSG